MLGLTLAACATLPETIRTPPPGNPSVAAVRSDAPKYVGAQVRWGGEIVGVQNEKSDTLVEVVAHELAADGQPRVGSPTQGRFLARFHDFLDPAVYSVGRELTVAGTVAGGSVRNVGQFPYRYAVVDVEEIYLWPAPPRDMHVYHPAPGYWDPWWPYWPYGPYW